MVLEKDKGDNNDINNKKSLPPKKRCKAVVEDVDEERAQKIKRKNCSDSEAGSIIPGVIRHTSCPDHCIAYVYKCK